MEMMTQLEQQHAARDEYDRFMTTFPSKQAVQAFLFSRANVFLAEKSAKAGKGDQMVLARKDRRKVARQIAKRLTKSAKGGKPV